jgi:hypothetical protein
MELNYRKGRPAVKKPLVLQDICFPCSKLGQAVSGQDYGEKVK